MHRPRSPASPSRLIAALALAAATSGHAEVGVTVGVDSDARYRGVSLSDSKPSARVTVNDDLADRWYVGASATSARVGATGDSAVQWLGYAGWTKPIGDGRHLELGIDASHFAGVSGYDFVEGYAGLLAEGWSTRIYFAPDYWGRHVRVAYAELDARVPVSARGRLFGHVGALLPLGGAHGDANRPRGDAALGVGATLGRWDLRLAWVAASADGPYPAVYAGHRQAVVAGVSLSF